MADDEETNSSLARDTLVHNEKVKLRATLFNTVAASFVIAGIITPVLAASRGAERFGAGTALLMIVWFLLAAALHYAATLILESLK